jgi:predicted membrane-bound spermidine synthase
MAAMPRQIRLLVSVFVSGAVVMALELLGSRILAPVFGNSIFVWGSLIGVVLASLSAGYYLGGKLADRRPELQTLSLVIFGAGVLILGIPTLAPAVFNAAIGISLGDRYSPLVATTLLLGPPSTLLGMVSPYAIRLAAKSFEKLGKASGNLYALSTIGSILGTFVTVFVLIPEFGVNQIIVALGATLLVIAFLGLGRRLKVFVLLFLIVLPFAAPYLVGHRLTAATYSLALGDTLYETDTPYHHLLVVDAYDPAYQSTIRYLILDDNFHSAMDLSNPDRDVFAYTEYFHLPFIMNSEIRKVLFIGGGGFTGPKSFLERYPNVTVDVVEIDPEVIRVAEQYFNVDWTNPRLHIYNEDGRVFLQQTSQRYDSVILDAYSKSYVPFHLMTEEFFRLLANHMTASGTVVSNLIAQTSGSSSQLLAAEVKTMQTVFPNVYAFATRGSDYPSLQNIIVLDSLSVKRLSEPELAQLAVAQYRAPPELRNDIDNYFVVATSNTPLLTDNYAPVETLLNPMTGQPLNAEESSLQIQDAEKIAALLFIMAVAFMILYRRRLM